MNKEYAVFHATEPPNKIGLFARSEEGCSTGGDEVVVVFQYCIALEGGVFNNIAKDLRDL